MRSVADLERRWTSLHTSRRDWTCPLNYVYAAASLPNCFPENNYDVVIAGGGLGLIAGAVLAARGLCVMVFDRDRVGAAHREWNISERELASLVNWGIFTRQELSDTIATRYDRGVISFDATGTGVPACPLQLSGVLDVALDAQSVLDLARKRFLQAGGSILENRSFTRLHSAKHSPVASVFEVNGPDGKAGYTAARGLLCLGDSAAGQSPLTFCGFGSFVRHIGRTAMLIDYALKHDLLERRHLNVITPHQANLRVAWVFSRFMQPWPGGEATSVNRIMNVFCKALSEAGPRTTRRFLQDRYTFPEYLRIMLTTARHEPGIFALTARVLGSRGLLKWLGNIVAFAANDSLKAAYKLTPKPTWRVLEQAASRYAPALALRLKSLRTNWGAIA